MPTVADVLTALDEMAPRAAAFDWDNPGLQIGDPASPVTSAVVALDPSLAALSFARDLRADLLLTHHPLLFAATKQLDFSHGAGKRVQAAIAANVAVIAAHTDWDLASPGLNDALAAQLGLEDVTPFGRGKEMAMLRLVTYVPEGAADRLLDALAEAGAGTIGRYRRCGFWNHGEGTFEPLAGAHPTIGRVGEREIVPEVRIETVLPAARRDSVLRVLRENHPYEEAAFGFVVVDGDQRVSGGRIGSLPPGSLEEISRAVADRLGAVVRVVGEEREVRRAAVFGGAGGGEWREAQLAGADVLVTGEVRHEAALEASEAGFTLIEAGHYATESPGVDALQRAMASRFPEVAWHSFVPAPGTAGRPSRPS